MRKNARRVSALLLAVIGCATTAWAQGPNCTRSPVAPASLVNESGTAVGIYQQPGEATGSDTVTNRGGQVIRGCPSNC